MAEPLIDGQTCLNCGTPLSGQYCARCGQRADLRLISLWELVRDAFGDLFELDSRLWRTLIPLLTRPGRLTRDYLRGRRARFMPPFRMYLVLSLVFFVIAFFDPRDDFALFLTAEEIEAIDQAEQAEREQESREELDSAREELEQLVAEGTVDPAVLEQPAFDEDFRFDDSGFNIECDPESFEIDSGDSFVGDWLARRLTPARSVAMCERLKVLGPDGVGAEVLDRVPAALLLLLPLMALVLKLLYPLSRRFYVEHLLFFVHFHSFFFLLLTLQVLWSRLIGLTPLPDAVAVLPIVATSFYVPAYLYVSMRTVYAQGRLLSALKFLVLALTYIVGFSFVMLGALILALTSI